MTSNRKWHKKITSLTNQSKCDEKLKRSSKGSSQKFAHHGQTKELSYGTLYPLPPSSHESVIDNRGIVCMAYGFKSPDVPLDA